MSQSKLSATSQVFLKAVYG